MSDATTTSKGANAPMMAAYLMLVACAMMWGSNHVVARGVNATVPLEALAFWRWVVAAVLLFPVCIPHLKRDLRLMADHKMSMFLIGTTGVFMFSIVIYLAAYNTTAVNTGLLNATTPVWVLLFAAVLTADKPKLGQWAGVLIAGVGTAVIIAKGLGGILDAFETRPQGGPSAKPCVCFGPDRVGVPDSALYLVGDCSQ